MTFSLGESPGGEQRSEAGKTSNGFELGHDSRRIWCNFVEIIYIYIYTDIIQMQGFRGKYIKRGCQC